MYGHDYAVPGTYEVTMVVAGRLPVFGEIVGTTKAGGEKPRLKPSALGQAVLDNEIPKIHHYYPEVDVWQVCLMPDHLHMIIRYMMRREYPDLFQRVLCVTIGGTRYSAFGNMLLLRQPEKHQVMFHRYTDGIPTEQTAFWETERQRLTGAAQSGDVLVNPGVSECEKRIKHIALEERLRMIHVQSEPIGRYWKPERSRFEACASGSLLILAPWAEDMPAFASAYARFHYLNRLAERICAISHATDVTVQGLRHAHGG